MTRGMGRKAIISLDEDKGTTPTRTWVKEMNSNENFCRNQENNGNSSDLRGKVDSFLRDGISNKSKHKVYKNVVGRAWPASRAD